MKKRSKAKTKHYREIYSIVLFALAVLMGLAIFSYDPHDIRFITSNPNVPHENYVGIVGAYLTWSLKFLVGHSIILVPILFAGWSLSIFFDKSLIRGNLAIKSFSGVLAFVALSTLFAMGAKESSVRVDAGGVIGAWLASDIFMPYLGLIGGYLLAATLLALSISLASNFLFIPFIILACKKVYTLSQSVWAFLSRCGQNIVSGWNNLKGAIREKSSGKTLSKARKSVRGLLIKRSAKTLEDENEDDEEEEDEFEDSRDVMQAEIDKVNQKVKQCKSKGLKIVSALKPSKKKSIPTKKSANIPQESPGFSLEGEDQERNISYKFPSTDLLQEPQYLDDSGMEEEIRQNAEILIQTMRQFNVDGEVRRVNNGPVLTTYEVEPAPGVKVNSILNLADNLAMSLKADSIRILAPIPGKSTVGIEVPNKNRNIVYLRELIESSDFQKSKNKLMLAFGKDILGNPIFGDLTEMPHLLIAGATNSGKTVCINTVITSLLYHASPQDVKLLLIDPKMVELAGYNGIPHLVSPVITDARKVPIALNWLIGEMERRYTLFSKIGVRNIDTYKVKKSAFDGEEQQYPNLPYIVTIIDELADLMMVSAQEIEGAITRLAQLARAVGIHLILATQRPSVDVVTGLIKANFPARISFKVASKVDSRTILDSNGADRLLGKGDMLYLRPGSSNITRGQCCYISDAEIEEVVSLVKGQGIEPQYNDEVLRSSRTVSSVLDSSQDALYDEAVQIVLDSEQASASLLQRRMRIGYARAARLVDMMEMNQIVSSHRGSKPREVLISREEHESQNDD